MSYRFILYKINEAPITGNQEITYVKRVKWNQMDFCSSPAAAQRMCFCMAYFIRLFRGYIHVKMVKI